MIGCLLELPSLAPPPAVTGVFRVGPAAWQVGALYRPEAEAYATSNSPAAPMPPPTHMVTTT